MKQKKKVHKPTAVVSALQVSRPPLPMQALLLRVVLILAAAAVVQHFLPNPDRGKSRVPSSDERKIDAYERSTPLCPPPPGPRSEPPRFTVGRDHHGWWVVEDRLGRVGGIFATEEAAMHYALEESNRDRNAVRRQTRSRPVEFRLSH